jgi:hypothetical protein
MCGRHCAKKLWETALADTKYDDYHEALRQTKSPELLHRLTGRRRQLDAALPKRIGVALWGCR